MYKQILILSAYLVCVNTSFSQLSIRNDAYLFVKDEVLFVNDNINLQETDSKIYCRNEAQLIQGTGITGNSGVGQVSIYQNGTTHNYAYNYWCSPVGNNSSIFGNENFAVNLIDDATGITTSTDASFTFDNGISSPLTIARYWIHTFEASTQYNQWIHRGDTGSISPGLGFTMKGTSGSSNNQLYDFRGKPNNGTIANSVSVAQWTLVGNPYPSAIDAVAYIHDVDNTNAITGTLYYWEQDLSVLSHFIADYVGGYATYTINAAGTVETFIPATFDTYSSDGSFNTTGSSSSSGKQAYRYIAIGQGFMVEGNATTTGNVYTKNTHRTYYKESESQSEFFRTGNQNDIGFIQKNETTETNPYGMLPAEYKRFRLNIDFNDVYTRQLVHTFHDTEATHNFDYGLESKSPFDVANDAYWITNNEPYIAQALPFNNAMTIPLHIKLNTNSAIRIRIFDVQNFDVDQEIYVHDLETGIYTDIRQVPFETPLDPGEYTDRFEIVFTRTTLNNEDVTSSDFTIMQNTVQQQLTINNPKLKSIKSIRLYDLLGKVIWSNEQVITKSKYTIDTSTLSEALYITKIRTQDHKTFSKKVIVKN